MSSRLKPSSCFLLGWTSTLEMHLAPGGPDRARGSINKDACVAVGITARTGKSYSWQAVQPVRLSAIACS